MGRLEQYLLAAAILVGFLLIRRRLVRAPRQIESAGDGGEPLLPSSLVDGSNLGEPPTREQLTELYARELALKHWDYGWCVAAALCYLGVDADSEERHFFQDYRPAALPSVRTHMRANGWSALVVRDPALAPLSALFEVLAPLAARIARERLVAAKTLPALEPASRVDLSAPTGPATTIIWAFRVLGVAPPPLFIQRDADRPSELVPPEPASYFAGERRFSDRSLAPSLFEVARIACFKRKENALRAWVGSLAELIVLYHATLLSFSPAAYAVPSEIEADVRELAKRLGRHVERSERASLQAAVVKLPATTGASEISSWLDAVEQTADRAGLLLAADLEAIAPLIEGSGDARKRRLDRLLSFSVSPTYVALRETLGLAIAVGD